MASKKNKKQMSSGNSDKINQELRENEELQIKELGEEVEELLNQEITNFEGSNNLYGNSLVNNLFAQIYNQVIAGDHELPDLPNRMREFAFRWMTEYRSTKDWAKLFNVSVTTIWIWRTNPKIVKYAAVIKYKRNALMLERNLTLENKAYTKLNEILDMKITEDNAEVMRKTILDTLNIIQQRLPRSAEPAAQITNINASAVQNKNKIENKVSEVDIKDIRDKLDEMELIEQVLSDKKKGSTNSD